MIDKNRWMEAWIPKLREAFGARLRYVGLQGSYRRNEAHEGSDFDVVTLLDALKPDDLRTIRRLLADMPEHEKACGFTAGLEEFQRWPRHELFQFRMDTDDCYGCLDALLPPVSEADNRRGLRVQAANLYHMACHTALYDPENTELLRGLYKSVFFALQLAEYLRSGVYCTDKRTLAARLHDAEAALLAVSMDFAHAGYSQEERLALLIDWCAAALREA